MRDLLEHIKYEAGYPGEDSMRTKAERLMKEELMKTPMTLPASHSTPSHEKMRLYKKGGHVKAHHSHKNNKEHERIKLHKMQHHGLEMAEKGLNKERKLSHGGRANEQGGHLTNLHLPHKVKLSIQSVKEAEGMRKGGRTHHKKHHMHHEESMHHEPHMHEHHEHRMHHSHHHKKHHAHKAEGGSIFPMLGDHPSTKRPHIDYERKMLGEHCLHHALGHSAGAKAHKEPYDASQGQYKKHGGHVKRHHTKKMAAGGVAKIRHGVATPSGLPIMRKVKRGY